MRVIIPVMLLLFVGPVAATVGFRKYQEYQAQQVLPPQAGGQWRPRGEVLFFNATWCGPCRQMKPIVIGMHRDGYRMRGIDVDKNRRLVEKYGINSVPTFVFVENGKEVNRFSGGTSAAKLRKMCDSPTYHN